MSHKYSKLFYRAVSRIRAIGANPGVVVTDRFRTIFHIGWDRAFKLREELTEAGVLRKWEDADLKGKQKQSKRGNIVWENMSKFKVPKEITKEEQDRVRVEKRKGKLPLQAWQLFK